MNNQEIRKLAERYGIKHWQIAKRYGMLESNFSRMLREELPTEKKEKIIQIINEIKKERD